MQQVEVSRWQRGRHIPQPRILNIHGQDRLDANVTRRPTARQEGHADGRNPASVACIDVQC
jgi:hypothetical protein